MTRRESEFQKDLTKKLKSAGAMVLNVHGHAMQAPGWPDLHVVHPLFFGWLELKREGGKLTSLQRITIRRIRTRGGAALVVREVHDEAVTAVRGEDEDGEQLFLWRWQNPRDFLEFCAAAGRIS